MTTVDETDAAAAAAAAAAASSARRAVDGTYIFQSAAAAAIGSAILVRPQPKAGLCSACVSYVFISL